MLMPENYSRLKMNSEDKDSDLVALLKAQKNEQIICDLMWIIKGDLLSSVT